MFAFSSARPRASRAGFLKPVVTFSCAALLAACSSTKQPAGPQVFAWLAPEPPPPAAAAAVAATDVELEDDGLPPQAPPPAGIRRMPDDPSAPWSRNYGRAAIGAADAGGAEPAATAEPAVEAAHGDDGLPLPKSPEEAGVLQPQQPRRIKGAALTVPGLACAADGRWKCVR